MKLSNFHKLITAVTVAGCIALGAATANAESASGYIYTSLNGEMTNQVVSFEIQADGTLGSQKMYSTGSKGGANRAAGGDAAGDFDSQGAIQIIGDFLLVANAGGNTITVFDLDRQSGALSNRANVSSEGTRPVSITFAEKPGLRDEYWVVVGNQWNNPNVQKGGQDEGPIEMYPNAAFHAKGGGHEQKLADRNIYLFSFDATIGKLSPERALDSYVGTNGGPATVAFNSDSSKLAVTTWGIAHFGTETPTHQKPSRVYVYNFDPQTGAASNVRHFEQEGIAGSIGFNWHKNSSTLYVSNFNLIPELRDNSLTVLRDDGRKVTKIANFGTGEGSDIDEACWTLLDPKGQKLYVSSFGGNFISVFDVESNGNVKRIGKKSETTFERRRANTPAGDTKDMYMTADGRHLYNLGAYQTFTVSKFDVANNGTLKFNDDYKVSAATEMGPGAYNFLGLAGFDK